MSARGEIKTILEADGALLATATGGIWDWDETGRLGISRETTPDAYTSAGVIQPCLLVKSRGRLPDGQAHDTSLQTASTREIVEIWFYQDEGYDSIDTMKARVFALLQDRQVPGTFRCRWAGNPVQEQRDPAMGNISVEREDYQVTALRTA
jgi:hypothetical protein